MWYTRHLNRDHELGNFTSRSDHPPRRPRTAPLPRNGTHPSPLLQRPSYAYASNQFQCPGGYGRRGRDGGQGGQRWRSKHYNRLEQQEREARLEVVQRAREARQRLQQNQRLQRKSSSEVSEAGEDGEGGLGGGTGRRKHVSMRGRAAFGKLVDTAVVKSTRNIFGLNKDGKDQRGIAPMWHLVKGKLQGPGGEEG